MSEKPCLIARKSDFLAVGAGGAIGAMMRYGMTLLGAHFHWNGHLPTLIVNLIGSFAIGLLVSSCEQGTWLLLATVGICGGFTTFSTFRCRLSACSSKANGARPSFTCWLLSYSAS